MTCMLSIRCTLYMQQGIDQTMEHPPIQRKLPLEKSSKANMNANQVRENQPVVQDGPKSGPQTKVKWVTLSSLMTSN
jgi:hypothetical protein